MHSHPRVAEVQPQNAQPGNDQPADAPQPAPPARPRRRVPMLVAAILVPVLLAAAVVVTYVAGGFNDSGQFRAEPPACTTLEPSLHLLGTAYTPQQTESNSCDLLLPKDHPDYIPYPKITVAYYVAPSHRTDAPDAASQLLRRLQADFRPLPGVGDEAYVGNRNVFLRVSNLVVAIVVFPRQASTEDQVQTFAADLASRLRDS